MLEKYVFSIIDITDLQLIIKRIFNINNWLINKSINHPSPIIYPLYSYLSLTVMHLPIANGKIWIHFSYFWWRCAWIGNISFHSIIPVSTTHNHGMIKPLEFTIPINNSHNYYLWWWNNNYYRYYLCHIICLCTCLEI